MILGLHGGQGAGKDTIAEFLVSRGWVRLAHADIIRNKLIEKNPYLRKHDGSAIALVDVISLLGWDVAKRSMPAIRKMLQDEGETDKKAFGRGTYAATIRRRIEQDLSSNYVVTDIRSTVEAESILGIGGYIVEVVRKGCEPKGDHASEHRLPDEYIDATVMNNGTIAQLENGVIKTLDYIANASVDGVPGEMLQAREARNRLMANGDGLSHWDKVRKFLTQMGVSLPVAPTPLSEHEARHTASMLLEEALEYVESCGYMLVSASGDAISPKNIMLQSTGQKMSMTEAADALADIDFAVNGNALRLGMVLEPIRHIVADDNLKKFDGGHRDANGKWIKPKGHKGPGELIEAELLSQSINNTF